MLRNWTQDLLHADIHPQPSIHFFFQSLGDFGLQKFPVDPCPLPHLHHYALSHLSYRCDIIVWCQWPSSPFLFLCVHFTRLLDKTWKQWTLVKQLWRKQLQVQSHFTVSAPSGKLQEDCVALSAAFGATSLSQGFWWMVNLKTALTSWVSGDCHSHSDLKGWRKTAAKRCPFGLSSSRFRAHK